MKMLVAYLDAGTGSMIASAVVAGAAGVGVAAKMGWRRITSPFKSSPDKAAPDPAAVQQPARDDG